MIGILSASNHYCCDVRLRCINCEIMLNIVYILFNFVICEPVISVCSFTRA